MLIEDRLLAIEQHQDDIVNQQQVIEAHFSAVKALVEEALP